MTEKEIKFHSFEEYSLFINKSSKTVIKESASKNDHFIEGYNFAVSCFNEQKVIIKNDLNMEKLL